MVRRAFLRWASAAAVAAAVTFPHLGLEAKQLTLEPLQPNERVQKVVLSPVLEALEKWNDLRCERAESAPLTEQVPLLKKKRANSNVNYYRVGGTFTLKTRREMLIAFGGIADEENPYAF